MAAVIEADPILDTVEDFEAALRYRRKTISGMELDEYNVLLDTLETMADR